jgi:hypothetical protein
VSKSLTLPRGNFYTSSLAFGRLPPRFADVAQLAEQLFCKQQVAGSSPIVGSAIDQTPDLKMQLGSCQSGQLGLAVNQVRKLRWFESATAHRTGGRRGGS